MSRQVGRAGAIRHRRTYNTGQRAPLSKQSIVRLCNKAGIRRISVTMYDGIKWIIREELDDVVNISSLYAENSKRKTLYPEDLVRYCRLRGKTLYGFENQSLLIKDSKKKTTRQKNKIKKEKLVKKELAIKNQQEKDSKEPITTDPDNLAMSDDDDADDGDGNNDTIVDNISLSETF